MCRATMEALESRQLLSTATIGSTSIVDFKGWGLYPANYDRTTPPSGLEGEASWLPSSGTNISSGSTPYVQPVLDLGFDIARVSISPNIGNSDGTLNSARMQDLKDHLTILKNGGINSYMFSNWTPPAYMKTPQTTAGRTSDGTKVTLNPNYVDGYAQYIVNVLAQLKNAGFSAPVAISVQNEPDVDAPYGGTYYVENDTEKATYRNVVKSLRSKLDNAGDNWYRNIQLLGPEMSGVSGMPNLLGTPSSSGWSAMEADPSFRDALGGIAYHTYATWDRIKDFNDANAHYTGKSTWMTEYSTDSGIRGELRPSSGNTALNNTINFMRRMGGDLVDLHSNYWFFWRGWHVTNNTQSDGTEDLTYGDGLKTKAYYVFQKLFQNVDPGWKVKQVTDDDADLRSDNAGLVNSYSGDTWSAPVDLVAFESGDASRSVMVLTNWTGNAKTFSVNGLKGSTAAVYRTSSNEDMASQGTVTISNGSIGNISLPAYSVVFISTSGTTSAPQGPTGYTYCADENQSYTFNQTVDVAYGANGSFNYKTGVTGTITFNNATFGDPIPGTVKHGFYKAASTSDSLISSSKTATASSLESSSYPASNVTDGSASTRWASRQGSDNEWIYIDLGSSYNVNRVRLNWEAAAGKDYKIQVKPDTPDVDTGWTDIKTVTGNTSTGWLDYSGLSGTGRYVRMRATARATSWGYSLWEFEVYGTAASSGGSTGSNALSRTGWTASASAGSSDASKALDGDTSTRWTSWADQASGQWFQVDLGSSQTFNRMVMDAAGFSGDYARTFSVYTSDSGTDWSSRSAIYSGSGSGQGIDVTFSSQTKRYIRVQLTAGFSGKWWSIAEFNLYNGSNCLTGTYYDNLDFTGTSVTRNDQTVNFDWGTGAPVPSMGADTFSVRWLGYLMPSSTGSYTITTTSDEGVRVWVNGTKLIDNWTGHTATDNSGTISMTAGQKYAIRVDYYENTGSAVMKLYWTPPGGSRQVIPDGSTLPDDGKAFGLASSAKLGGTAIGTSGSYGNSGNTIAKVFDGSLSSYFDAPTAGGAWVGLDLGSAKTITTIRFAPRSGLAGRMTGGYFQVSNTADFSIATTIYTISGTPTDGSLTTVNLGVSGTWRYIRYVSPANGYCNIAELEVWGY